MPKKTRKAKMRAAQRPVTPGYVAPVPRPVEREDRPVSARPSYASSGAPVSRSAAMPRAASPITLDYGYVFRDLRRIALLAAGFFVIMLVLWYVIEVQHISLIPGIL